MLLAMIALAGQMAPDATPFAQQHRALATCIISTAVRWAPQRDAADVIARGAASACIAEETSLREAMIASNAPDAIDRVARIKKMSEDQALAAVLARREKLLKP